MSCAVLLAPIGSSATTTIYKCLDNNLGITYTDEPCKDGERMNIRAGDADPAAVARLERARDAMDQRTVQRSADDRRADQQQNLVAGYALPNGQYAIDNEPEYAPYDSGAVGLYPDYGSRHPHRAHLTKARERPHVVPSQPRNPAGR